MKANNFNTESRKTWSRYILPTRFLIAGFLILASIQVPLQAQEVTYTKPSLWFGLSAGANYNLYQGSTQKLNSNMTSLAVFHNGTGFGLYLAPLLEYYKPESRWGLMLQLGYDNRRGKFSTVYTPCNCPADLLVNLSYFTIEPSLRFAPFKSSFYLFAGPRFAINVSKNFTYQMGVNPEIEGAEEEPEVKGDLSNIHKSRISMQIGAGVDIPISSHESRTQFVMSPFITYHPYFGQAPRSIETWNINTIRVGIAFKFGRGHKTPVQYIEPAPVVVPDPDVQFTVYSPKNIPIERKVTETFPLLNYIFFDLGSADIPDRYIKLRRDQVGDFKEENLKTVASTDILNRSGREMVVYYNVLNILGDRMGKNRWSTIALVGSSEKGKEDGLLMAESVKKYLVDVFSIEGSRISLQGRDKPKIPSEQPGGTIQLELLRQGDRRVTIESSSENLLMEFRNGPDAPLRPVEIITLQEAPLDSYVSFTVDGGNKVLDSWSMEIKDEKGNIQNYGPFVKEKVSIPGKSILGARPVGDFTVTMIGKTKNDKIIRKEVPVHIALWSMPIVEDGMRFSVVFDFDKSNTIEIYNKYLTDVVTPKIPINGTVMIHGYTDIIGDESHNLGLSLARANEVRSIIEQALTKADRTDVNFKVYGFGEDESLAQFGNKFPEERFYNRTVIIDIIPKSNMQ